MNNKITFPELVDLVAQNANTTKRMSELFLKELFATIAQTLTEGGESVTVKGIGTFKITAVGARKSVNVNTGEEIEIPGHNKLSFAPDKDLADAINQPFAHFETEILADDISDSDLAAVEQQPAFNIEKETITEEETPETPEIQETPEVPEIPETPETPEIPEIPEVPEIPEPIEEEVEENIEQPEEEYKEEEEYEEEEENRPKHRHARLEGFLLGVVTTLILCLGGYRLFLMPNTPQQQAAETPQTKEQQQVPADTTATTIATVKDSVKATDTIAQPEAKAPAKVDTPITETVKVGTSLEKLAKKHFKHSVFWVYILEENRAKIKNPNNIPVGTTLIIPAAEKYGIDANNAASVSTAKQKQSKLYSEFN